MIFTIFVSFFIILFNIFIAKRRFFSLHIHLNRPNFLNKFNYFFSILNCQYKHSNQNHSENSEIKAITIPKKTKKQARDSNRLMINPSFTLISCNFSITFWNKVKIATIFRRIKFWNKSFYNNALINSIFFTLDSLKPNIALPILLCAFTFFNRNWPFKILRVIALRASFSSYILNFFS